MLDGLKTRQVNALRLLLERRDFTAADVAALDYHFLARMPGIGGKSLDIIREWLAMQGLDLANSPDDGMRSLRFYRLEARLNRAKLLLEKHGYSIIPPAVAPQGKEPLVREDYANDEALCLHK